MPFLSIGLKPFRSRSTRVASPEAAGFAQIACFGHSAVLRPWLLATMGQPGWHPYLDASRDPSGACFELRVGGFSHFEQREGGFSRGRAFVASAW